MEVSPLFRKVKIEVSFILAFLLTFVIADKAAGQSGYEIIRQVFDRTKEIGTMSFTMKKVERINGVMMEQVSYTKLSRNPFKVYSKQVFPKKGVEVLYVHGSNNNKALINPNGFPWMNLWLSPYGSTMRENQHHTILDSGFDHVISILEHLFDKYGEETKSMASNIGTTVWDGDTCWVVMIKNPHFKYYDYTVRQGESLLTIADKFKLSEFMLLERNKKVKGYESVVAGQVISIPNDYSPKMILFIDKKKMIPLMMQIYDELGLYELYEYTNIIIDPILKPGEFTKDFEEYDF